MGEAPHTRSVPRVNRSSRKRTDCARLYTLSDWDVSIANSGVRGETDLVILDEPSEPRQHVISVGRDVSDHELSPKQVHGVRMAAARPPRSESPCRRVVCWRFTCSANMLARPQRGPPIRPPAEPDLAQLMRGARAPLDGPQVPAILAFQISECFFLVLTESRLQRRHPRAGEMLAARLSGNDAPTRVRDESTRPQRPEVRTIQALCQTGTRCQRCIGAS